MSASQAEILIALERHGLPTWGTPEQLQARYDANFKAPKPAEPKQSFRGRPKGSGASKTDVHLHNELLANKASSQPVVAVETEEVTNPPEDSTDAA